MTVTGHTATLPNGFTYVPPCAAPHVTAHPMGATITAGSPYTMNVVATGTAPFSYQWYIGTSGDTSTPINGATSSTVMVMPFAATSYWARVSNSCGSADSNTATVLVQAACAAPEIVRQPESVQIGIGTEVHLFVGYLGSPATVQWYSGESGATGQPIDGATSQTLTLHGVTHATRVWARLTNACGTANSDAATITLAGRRRSASH